MNFIHHDRVLQMQLYFDYQMRSFLDESTTTIKQQMLTDHWFYTEVHFVFFGVFLVKLGVCTTNRTT